MRRLLGILALIALAAGVVCAQTVTVTKPQAGEVWVKGSPYTIMWNKDGIMPNLVRISLRNANTLAEVGLIQDNVSNTGSFQWSVPANIAVGQYRVRVKVKDVAIQDDSDIFSIAVAAPVGTITVLDPGPGYTTVWREGQAHTAKWWITGSLTGKYTVSLMDSTGSIVVDTLSDSVNCCSIGTNHPLPFVPGQYLVRVRDIPSNVFGDSQVFTLSPDSIIVTQPAFNVTWQKTKTYNITWKRTGTQPNTVKIELTGTYHIVLDLDAPNTGSFSWTIPSWLSVGQYGILITTNQPGLFGECRAFHIGFPHIPEAKKIIKKK